MPDESMDRETAQIQAANLAGMVGLHLVAIVETKNGFTVHQHTPDAACPQSVYPTKRLAVARVLQLLGLGPVGPQTWPEEACISTAHQGVES